MFYYPNVLQRHTGCFATIWLAATRGSRLLRREYLTVNVVKTCEEILNYVLVRVPPPKVGLPRPRFSLYLSAQLQIGVIRVYCRQCQYLVEDIQHVLERLHRAQQQIRIDMEEPHLPSLLPNCLTMMEALEDAPDPFFGMMSMEPRLPSPYDIPQIRHLLEAKTPTRPLDETLQEVPSEPRKLDRTLVSPETITMQEEEPIRVLPIEGERDLPEVTSRDLELLLAEEDEALLLEEQLRGRLPQVSRASPTLDESKEEPRAMERESIVPPLSPPALTQIEEAAKLLPGQVLDLEELRLTGWEPGAPLLEVTPPQKLQLPAPLSPERRRPPASPPPARRRRRRRQLLFWDKETQISRKKFHEQLQTRAHCQECPMVQPPEKTLINPAELFSTPTYSGWLPPELLAFWTRCAQPPPRALQRRPPQEPEEVAAEEERRKTETLSDIEVLREAQEPSGPLMLSSELSLEAAEEDKSRTSLAPLEERWPWAEAEQPEAPPLPVVPELPEVPMELPPEPELLSLEAVHRAVVLQLQANRELDFSGLVLPLSSRRMAARVFSLLLVLLAQQILSVVQETPYGRLLIKPGPRFHCG
ncbi:meiotic recombination protein REC8 homolog [Erinaceus europaeus]|uniref:Meiotic recombination protein REC8 homolog n=1 Tax=Erinaceus europaeus TaxID=9365 RepID=A0ABM3W3W1_ERIEU|nr:meiotic recombination protein REC8 homolog [Erinaceus europaeus]